MDRLIGLVRLRLTLDLRALLGSRSRVVALLVSLPALGLLSLGGAVVGFWIVRLLEHRQPELVLPAISALATLVGLSWALAPLFAGVAASETPDLTRLVHFPIPAGTLLAASLVASLAQPMTLAQLPPLAAVALALAGRGPRLVPALGALCLALAFALACGQVVGLALHAVSRRRRWHDVALLLGVGVSLSISVVPLVLLSGHGGLARRALAGVLRHDLFALSPFSWGARAAVHASRGETAALLAWASAAALAVLAAVMIAAVLAQRLYRGELDLGEARSERSRRATMPLPGPLGALLEKDLRIAWRDPRQKALMLTGLIGPLIILIIVWQGLSSAGPGLVLAFASLSAVGIGGANALAFERQGLTLLFGFPVGRSLILIAKNLNAIVFRLPALAVVVAATVLVAGPRFVPAVVTIVLLTELAACALDNYVSLLLPVPVAAAGRDPNAAISGTRGLGSSLVGLAAVLASLALSAPFAFLGWLPYLLGAPWLWALTLPLALAGMAAVYAMLVAGAARLLARREPELVARALGDE